MYRYRNVIDFHTPESMEPLLFGLRLEKTDFEFMNGQYSFRRGNQGHSEEILVATHYSNIRDDAAVYSKMENELRVLSYFFQIPLTALDIRRRHVETVLTPDALVYNGSVRKISQLSEFSNIISRMNQTKPLFTEVISIYNSALRHLYMDDYFQEDAFLGFFRIIEKIASWSYDYHYRSGRLPLTQNRHRLSHDVEHEISKYLSQYLQVTYCSQQYQRLIDTFIDNMESATKNIYSKICLFCNQKNIPHTSEQIHTFVDLRNQIAHGMISNLSTLTNNLSPIHLLANEMISNQFFNRSFCTIEEFGFISHY